MCLNEECEMNNVATEHLHEAAEIAPIHTSELLDEGLEESFPASDPPAVNITRIIDDTPQH